MNRDSPYFPIAIGVVSILFSSTTSQQEKPSSFFISTRRKTSGKNMSTTAIAATPADGPRIEVVLSTPSTSRNGNNSRAESLAQQRPATRRFRQRFRYADVTTLMERIPPPPLTPAATAQRGSPRPAVALDEREVLGGQHDDGDDDTNTTPEQQQRGEEGHTISGENACATATSTSVSSGDGPLDPNDAVAESVRRMADNLMELLRSVKFQDPQHCGVIDLERKRLPATYVRALLKYCVGGPVRRIRLYKVAVADCHAIHIADLIRHPHSAVADLDLGKNDLTDAGLRTIAAALPDNNGKLRRLVLSGNCFTAAAVSILLDKVRRSNIESLKLSKVQLDEACIVQSLCPLLADTDAKLARLELRNCGLDAHVSSIAAVLRQQLVNNKNSVSPPPSSTTTPTTLAAAAASETSVGDSHDGARRRRTKLFALYLAENGLHDAHMATLIDGLRGNTSIQVLDLQYNPLTDITLHNLVDCLQRDNHTVQKLKLRHCPAIDHSTELKEDVLDLLLMNAHGPDLAARTKRAERCIVQGMHMQHQEQHQLSSLPDLTDTSFSLDDDEHDTVFALSPPPQPEESKSILKSSSSSSSSIETDCAICFEPNPITSAVTLLPCGHQNCCSDCAAKLQTCHMCRETVVKVFSTTEALSRQQQRQKDPCWAV
jgi:Ran GTPase-activating protein (RanGAP) involved in mRNA processing and transport